LIPKARGCPENPLIGSHPKPANIIVAVLYPELDNQRTFLPPTRNSDFTTTKISAVLLPNLVKLDELLSP